MLEYGRVPRKGRIRTTIKKHSGRVLEKGRISVSTRNCQNPGESQEKVESVPLLKNCPDEFQEKGRISVSTGTW